MAISKSILEEVELEANGSLYVQIGHSNTKASLSFDGPEASFSLWVSKKEAEAYAKAILKALEEANE